MKKHLIKLCACAVSILLLLQIAPIIATAAMTNSAYDDYFWRISIYPNDGDSDTIYAYAGDTVDDIQWPETATVQFYTTSVRPYIRDYYTVSVEKPTQEYLEEQGVDLSREDRLQIMLDVTMPVDWEDIYRDHLSYTSYVVCYFIEIQPERPLESELHFNYDLPYWEPPIFDCMMPDTWELPETAECFIKDKNGLIDQVNLGELSVTWDVDDIEYEEYYWDDWQCATVYGTVTIPDGIDISGIGGISEDGTAQVEILCTIKPYKPISFCSQMDNPELYNFGGDNTYVSFFVDYIGSDWDDDFSIWFTEDDGRIFNDVTRASPSVRFDTGFGQWNRIDIRGLNTDKWYGISLELRGNHLHSGTTETIYFKIDGDDITTEPSTGDRGGDGRWPFSPTGQSGNNGGNDAAPPAGVGGVGNPGNNGDGEEAPPAGGNEPGNDNGGGNGSDTPSTGNGTGSNDNSSGNNTGNQSGDSSSSGGSSSSTSSTPASFGSNTGAISGQRLDALMTVYPQNVPFVDNGAQLQIPADFIKSLGISQNGTFSVNITKIVNGSFSISVFANGKAAAYSGSKPLTLRIPYTPSNGNQSGNLVITDADGNIQPFSYYSNEGYIVLKSNQLGKFSIVEGKPATFSDIQNSYIDFLSARGVISQTADQKYNPYIAAKQNELHEMLAKLPGSAQPVVGQSYPQTRLTYSAAVSLLESYSKQIGITVDRKKLLSILSISEDSLLSRYGCAKLVAEYMKSL